MVSTHFLEDCFVVFNDPNVRDDMVDRMSFPSGGRDFDILPWSMDRHSSWVAVPYHVRLCIEGLPNEAWNSDMVGRIMAGRGSMHFIESSSVRREDTIAFNAWVWTRDPRPAVQAQVQPHELGAG